MREYGSRASQVLVGMNVSAKGNEPLSLLLNFFVNRHLVTLFRLLTGDELPTAAHGQHISCDEGSAVGSQEHSAVSHILWRAHPLQDIAVSGFLPLSFGVWGIFVAHLGHGGLCQAGQNAVDPYTGAAVHSQAAGQHFHCCLGRTISHTVRDAFDA